VEKVVLRGRVVVANGQVIGEKGGGQLIESKQTM
jgi:hypothetical protein